MSDWTAITVTYNSEQHLRRHWAGVERDFRWIVVDNGSTDSTLDVAAESGAEVVVSGGNVGFSAGNNIALKMVDTDYVLFVNPDVSVPGDGWQATLSAAVNRTGGLVSPQLLNPDGTEQANARGYPFLEAKILNRLKPNSDLGRRYARTGLTTQTYCAWLMGAAVAARTETANALRGWDPEYFLYYEDHDLGLRAWSNDVPVSLTPEVRWIHAWQRATKGPNFKAWRAEIASMRRFYQRHPLIGIKERLGRKHAVNERLRATYGELPSLLWRPVESDTTKDNA